MQNAISKLIACGVICAFSIGALLPAFHSPGQPMDEGMVLLYPEMFLKAHLPYRDFEMIYGPGNLFSLSAAASADWLLLNRRWDFINEPNKSSQFDSDALNEIVRRNFDFWFETGSYQLFRSKMLASAVVPPPA